MVNSHLGAAAIAMLGHIKGFEVEQYANAIAPLLSREAGAVKLVGDG